MARKTLIEMVQSIMSDMDSDEVTSISDTVESEQVASTIRDVYEQFCANDMIPEHQQLTQFVTGATNKVYFYVDLNLREVNQFFYEDTENQKWIELKWVSPQEFLTKSLMALGLDNTESVTDPLTPASLIIYNDRQPSIFTSFDDTYYVCDAYKSSVDASGLVFGKTKIVASYYPAWTQSDSFIIPVDENIYPYLLAEAKGTCFVNLKQQSNPKIESQARRQRVKIQHGKFRTTQAEKDSLATAQPSFGRGRP